MRVGVRNLLRLSPRGVRVAIDEGLFLRIVRHNPPPHPPCLCFAPAIHLPVRNTVGPLWLKTVTRGLFLRHFVPPRRAPRGEGFKTVSHRGHLAGAYMFHSGSIARDFSTNARNDIVLVWFYNVISTGVRTTVRTQRRNPPRKRWFVRVRSFSFRSRSAVSPRGQVGWRGCVGGISFPRDCRASLAMTRRYGCSLGLIMIILINRRTRV